MRSVRGLPVLQVFSVPQAGAGVPIDEGLVVELLVLQVLGGARHQCQVTVGWVLDIAGSSFVELFPHTLDNFTKQSFG